jgi:organic radical activating enzyme
VDWKQTLRGVAGAGRPDEGDRPRAAASRGEPRATGAGHGSRAPLVEIFASVQGEGRFVGLPMVFVRTATCPLRCLYCDTINAYAAAESFPVRLGPREQREGNPCSAARAAELVRLVLKGTPQHKAAVVSLTGGEPLVFPDFVRELGAALRQQGARLHLETAAVDPDALQRCVEQVDHLSADYKLPATLGAPVGGPPPDAGGGYAMAHLRCCEIALRRGASVDVKVVLTPAVADHAFAQALEVLQPVKQRIALILQPVTPVGEVRQRLAGADLARLLALALRAGFDARVLPQVHRILQLP